jgi:ferrous iron transport protein A
VFLAGDIESDFQFALVPSGNPKWTGRKLKMTLDTIPRDVSARVASVEASGTHGLRLMEMGVVPGALIRVVKSAPLGDPIQVCVRNYHLALRRAEAQSITVTLIED